MIIFKFWLKSNTRITPFDVPRTIKADTARHVGEPKFLLPDSENAKPSNFSNFVQRTTSQGGELDSVSLESSSRLLVTDSVLLWPARNAGEEGRGESTPDEPKEENLLSKGLKEGVGPLNPGRSAKDGTMLLLPGDETTEPCMRHH